MIVSRRCASCIDRMHQSAAHSPFACIGADAVTVSYTEVVVSADCVVMRYKNGAPCSSTSVSESSLATPARCKFSSRTSTNR